MIAEARVQLAEFAGGRGVGAQFEDARRRLRGECALGDGADGETRQQEENGGEFVGHGGEECHKTRGCLTFAFDSL